MFFYSILKFMKDLYQSENQVFNPTRLFVLLHCWVGKDWAGPFFPPPKSFDLSIDQLVFRFMLLFHCILTLMNDRFQRENQVFKPNIFCTATLWGWERMGRPILSPPLQNVLIFLFIFQSFSLCYYFTVSEDLWMTHSKEIIKFSNQKVYWLSPSKVFQPLYFNLVNWFFQIVGWGKTGPIFL